MKKNSIINVVLFIFLFFSSFFVTSEDYHDVLKFRWVSCFIDYYDFDKIVKMDFSLVKNFSDQYFKYRKDFPSDYRGYKFPVFDIIGKRDSDKYYFIDKPDYLRDEFPNFNDFVYKVDIKRVISDSAFSYVTIDDYNNFMLESGRHFISYNSKDRKLYSDSKFGKRVKSENVDFYDSNDNFDITILSMEPMSECLLFESFYQRKAFIPMERLFETGREVVCTDTLKLYKNPDINEKYEIVKNSKQSYVRIIDVIKEWRLINNELSIWVKINTSDNKQGWVWGRQLRIVNWMDMDVNSDIFKKYAKYELLKLPLSLSKKINYVNKDTSIRESTKLYGFYYIPSSIVETLKKHEEIFIIYESNIEYNEELKGVCKNEHSQKKQWLFIRTKNGDEGWCKSEFVDGY